jgi:hypothetical protein
MTTLALCCGPAGAQALRGTAASAAPFSLYTGGGACYYSFCFGVLIAVTPIGQQVTTLGDPTNNYAGYPAMAAGGTSFFAADAYEDIFEVTLGNAQPVAEFKDPGLVMAASGDNTLFIAHGNGVNVYPPGATTPSRTITQGITNVIAMAVGQHGELYVSNGNDIEVYALRGSAPLRTITSGIAGAKLLTFDPAGRLVVFNSQGTSITIYPPGGTAPIRTIAGVTGATWISIGPTLTVYVAQHGSGKISEYDHEGSQLSRTITAVREPLVTGVDSQDNLYVLNDGNVIFVRTFPHDATKPSTTWKIGGAVISNSWTAGATW